MKKYNILKIISIIVSVILFVCSAGSIFSAIHNYNIDINLIIDGIASFMMGIGLLLTLYLSDIW